MRSAWFVMGAPLLVASLIAASSFLGLLLGTPKSEVGVVGLMSIWRQSSVADAWFIVGSTASAIASFAVARRRLLFGVIVGCVSTWFVYGVSYVSLPDLVPFDITDMVLSFLAVAVVGFPGIIFAGCAPPIAARLWQRKKTPQDRAIAVEFEVLEQDDAEKHLVVKP